MNIFSSSPSSSSKFTLFSPSQNPNSSRLHFIVPLKTPHSTSSHRILPPIHSHHESSSPSPVLQEKPQNSESEAEDSEMEDGFDEEIMKAKKSLEELLVVRRPVMEFSDEEAEGVKASAEGGNGSGSSAKLKEVTASSGIDEGLSRFAKKMPIFEPERVESSSEEKPLLVNLDLALYRAKILARNYRYEEAEEILRKVDIKAKGISVFIDLWFRDV